MLFMEGVSKSSSVVDTRFTFMISMIRLGLQPKKRPVLNKTVISSVEGLLEESPGYIITNQITSPGVFTIEIAEEDDTIPKQLRSPPQFREQEEYKSPWAAPGKLSELNFSLRVSRGYGRSAESSIESPGIHRIYEHQGGEIFLITVETRRLLNFIMGNWKLEVGRMAMYMAFPVALFHYFNQPTYFEEWVTNTKREIFPPENKENKEAIKKLIQDMRKKELDSYGK
ncbi:Protein PET100 homolog, mitochondrial [Eumeta japonica]|uniref:Protein PET100 homolog, mitochondrial n=1 Tax=Eumeta variegata TaxID=151549 RepID=A0A4C1VMQ8_EUMVA|nr:Protein PET100 homolog, mitochondrial [Eumeta japonica]